MRRPADTVRQIAIRALSIIGRAKLKSLAMNSSADGYIKPSVAFLKPRSDDINFTFFQ